jgi:hypothetical protein
VSIVNDFNARGVLAMNGGPWSSPVLRRTLRNPYNAPLLGQDRWERVDRLLARRQQQGRPAEHLLGGILVCTCGQRMYSVDAGKHQAAYRCTAAKWSGGRSKGCGKTAVSEPAADRWAEEAFIAAVCSDDFIDALNRRQSELLAGEATAQDLDDWREEIGELEQVMPTRFAPPDAKRRHDDLRRMVDQATARLMEQPELQTLLDLPRSEDKLRARWDAWSIGERRTWLRRVLEHVTVQPATARGRASDVGARMAPQWRL